MKICSYREHIHYPSYDIVYDWEDEICKETGYTLYKLGKWELRIYRYIEKFKLTNLFHRILPKSKDKRLYFEMHAKKSGDCMHNKNTIPVLIDFWLTHDELDDFYRSYKHVPMLLVTNREVFDLIKSDGRCPVTVRHWALSYPSKYRNNIEQLLIKKNFEFALIGRPNPFFVRLLDQYVEKHPDFEYIRNNGDITNRIYETNKGKFIEKDTGRESYINMIKNTKISCYSTPGIDESKKESSEYNQVTPRLFEMLSCGCNVIGHYPLTSDTIWYDLNSIIPNVDNYEQFEAALDYMRTHTVNINRINAFLDRHETSRRANELKQIVNNI